MYEGCRISEENYAKLCAGNTNQEMQIADLQNCEIAKLRNFEIAKLRNCELKAKSYVGRTRFLTP